MQFMDSITLRVLVEQRNNLHNIGKELVLIIQGSDDAASSEEHPVGRLLHLTGQAGEFSVYDDRVAAIKSIVPSS